MASSKRVQRSGKQEDPNFRYVEGRRPDGTTFLAEVHFTDPETNRPMRVYFLDPEENEENNE